MSFYTQMEKEIIMPADVLYMRRTGAYGTENYALMDRFKEWLHANQMFCEDTVILAVPLDDPNRTETQKCRYDVCVINAEGGKPTSDEVKSRKLDGGSYLVFRIAHTAGAVQRAWSECFEELSKHGYSLDPARPIMERYAQKLVEHHLCELCVPIL